MAAEVVAQSGPVGGGSVPTQLLPTFAVALPADKLSPNQAEQALRCPGKAHHRPHHRGPAAAGRADHLPGGHGVYR